MVAAATSAERASSCRFTSAMQREIGQLARCVVEFVVPPGGEPLCRDAGKQLLQPLMPASGVAHAGLLGYLRLFTQGRNVARSRPCHRHSLNPV
ncbi:MAG: hypothetical protein AW07_02324 [Candidatus Accumulibacter sp. SK-11]|nr:MAG: hypothetical protein AW07_02324 [Candidatus Accumulibacter sp. SK-11]